jgi:hypothetical protein
MAKKKSEKVQTKKTNFTKLDIFLAKTAVIILTIICLKIALGIKLFFALASKFIEISMQLIVNFFNIDIYIFLILLVLLLIKPFISQIKK